MALKKEELKSNIKEIMQDMLLREETSINEFSDRIANVIDAYIKDAEIIYKGGLTSATGGMVTGEFLGKIN